MVVKSTRNFINQGLSRYLGTFTGIVLLGVLVGLPSIACASEFSVYVPDAAYTGKPVMPCPTVTYAGQQLVRGADYVTSWRNNTNAGLATIRIQGVGRYVGQSASSHFVITKAQMSSAVISGIPSKLTWTGNPLVPKPMVSYNGKLLKEGLDYRLQYTNNTAPTTHASVTVIPLRNFSGACTIYFTIEKNGRWNENSLSGQKGIDISNAHVSKLPSRYASGIAIKPKPEVRIGGKPLKRGRDYTVTYRNNTKPGKGFLTINGIRKYTGTKTVSFTLLKIPPKLSLNRKKALIFGDSIQAPGCGAGAFIESSCRLLHARAIKNKSRSGATLSTRKERNNLVAQVNSAASIGSYDLYFIAAGTNDISHSYSLGKKTSKNTKTVCGSINTVVNKITKAHVKKKGNKPPIVVITPIGRGTKSTNTMNTYRKAIALAAASHENVIVIDGAKLASDTEMRNSRYTNDKLHPKRSWGSSTVANRLVKELNARRKQIYYRFSST